MKEEIIDPNSASVSQGLPRSTERWSRLLRRLWWVFLVFAIAGVTVGILWTAGESASYTAHGRMIVNVKLSLPEGSFYTEELSNFMGTQSALMQSPAVLNRARARAAAASGDDPDLVGALRVAVLPKTTIFILSATGHQPEITRAFVQACMEEYLSLKKEMRAETSDTTVAGLTEQVLKLEQELRQAENALVDFQTSNSPIVLAEQASDSGAFLAGLHQRLTMLKWEEELLQHPGAELLRDRNAFAASFVSGAASTGNDLTTSASTLDYLKFKQQLKLLRTDEEELSRVLRPKHPKMIALREEIARRERMLAIYDEQNLQETENRKKTLALQIQRLTQDVNAWEKRTTEASRRTAELARLKSSAQRTQTLYDRLLATLQTLDVNAEISPESVTLMDEASEALLDVPQYFRNVVAGLGIGLLAAFALLGFVNHLDDRLHTARDIEEILGEPVLAQVPWQAAPVKLIEAGDARHAFVEAFRSLRSSLLFMPDSASRPRTLLVTSSTPGEGKSLVAVNLALMFAEAGLKVMLVDGDGRKGALDRLFEVSGTAGLSQILTGDISWKEGVAPTRYGNLAFIPRGVVREESFLGKIQSQLLESARSEYEVVVIDSPPVLAVDDATTLGPLVDGVLFVALAGQTSARVARAALEGLYRRRANVLGLVFNGVAPNHHDYFQYHRYPCYRRPLAEVET